MSQSIAEKALRINLTRPLYGTLAEIGAGQEVSRWFFKVGGAAGTIAKAMSAYDKSFSDSIYGPEDGGRYVVESRIHKMLDHEFQLLENRLTSPSEKEKYFFAYANTVAAKSYKYDGDCHGWMGVRFQRNATESPSQIILHVRMLDKANLQQQEALGILGVNLIYGAYYHSENLATLLESLVDGEIKDRLEINLIRFDGDAFKNIDSIEANLYLLGLGLTPSILIPKNKPVSHLSEELYKKQVICFRGRFNPPLLSDLDILKSSRDLYCGNKTEGECAPYLISELKAVELTQNVHKIEDYKKRVHQLHACDQNVLLTNLERAYQLSEHIGQFSNNHINITYRAQMLIDIFENYSFQSLEPLARVFNDSTRIYIYPSPSSSVAPEFHKNPNSQFFRMSDYKPSSKNELLYRHLVQEQYMIEIEKFDQNAAQWDLRIFEDLNSKKDPKATDLLPKPLR